MKLIAITTMKAFEKDICNLFKISGIEIYSTTNIDGHKIQKPKNIQDNWFSAQRDTYSSKLYFAFTSEELIDKLLKEIEVFNTVKAKTNPVKAVVLNVEKFI